MDNLQDALCTSLRDGAGWPAEMAAEVGRHAHIVSFEKDATVFHAGEQTDLLYVLLSGEVRLYYGTDTGERLLVSIVRSGQMFGSIDFQDMDATPQQEQLFTAQTLSRSKVAVIARARVTRLLHDLPGPELTRIVQREHAKWMALSCRLLTFMTQDVRSRLAHTIAEISKAFGIADARGKLIALRLSHEDFAELVGASRPMVSKHLKDFATRGIFVKQNGRYIVLREDALADLAASREPVTRQDTSLAPIRRVNRPTFTRELPPRSAAISLNARRSREAVARPQLRAAAGK